VAEAMPHALKMTGRVVTAASIKQRLKPVALLLLPLLLERECLIASVGIVVAVLIRK
jgi:hypothetical protein